MDILKYQEKMNVNFKNIIAKNIPKGIVQPRRSQIYVGFQCHQRCGFCYYKEKCHDSMFPLDQIFKQIDFAYSYGIRDFEITGGEPSEFNDLRRICEYIKSKNSKSKIAIITNGGLFKSNVFDIIDEVLISYHLGKTDRHIDYSFFPLGNTYSKVRKLVDLCNQHPHILLRTNTVLGVFNLHGLDFILNDLLEFKPKIINFLPLNLFDQASKLEKFIDYDVLRKKLPPIIDVLKQQLPNSLVFVRYVPFCILPGYEKHIVGNMQHIFDWFDWNRELDGIDILSKINNVEKSLAQLGEYGSTSIETVFSNRRHLYSKTNDCLRCKYFLICDGVEKTQSNALEHFINSQPGKYITNPLQFISDATYKLYNTIYNSM